MLHPIVRNVFATCSHIKGRPDRKRLPNNTQHRKGIYFCPLINYKIQLTIHHKSMSRPGGPGNLFVYMLSAVQLMSDRTKMLDKICSDWEWLTCAVGQDCTCTYGLHTYMQDCNSATPDVCSNENPTGLAVALPGASGGLPDAPGTPRLIIIPDF